MRFPWIKRGPKHPGWVAVGLENGLLRHVHVGAPASEGGRPAVLSWSEDLPASAAPANARQNSAFARHRCSALLEPSDYQMVSVDAIDLPAAELKAAMRWKIKDLVEFPVEHATIDILPIPDPTGRAAQVFVVAARNDTIRDRMNQLERAGIPLQAIDIVETAQRNIATLFEEEGRAVAYLYFDDNRGLFTISQAGELLFARRLDFSFAQIRAAGDAERAALFDRIGLELQRTLDNFERQNRMANVSRIVVGPEPEDSGLAEFLRNALSLPVLEASLGEVLDFPNGGTPPARQQWRNLHLIGCALRGAEA